MLAAWIAAGASLIAAGLAARSALISTRLAAQLGDQSRRQEWRREYILPIVASILTTQTEVVRILYPRPDYERTDEMGERDVADEVCRNTMLPKVAMLQLTASQSVYEGGSGPTAGLQARCPGIAAQGQSRP